MTDTLLFWVGNLEPAITQIVTSQGAAVDLTGSTVKFSMRPVGSGDAKVAAASAAFVTDGTDGAVKYEWVTGDVDTAGLYLAWWTVTTGGSSQDVAEAVVEFRDHAPTAQPAYVELEVFKSSMEMRGKTYADVDIQAALLSASRTFEKACGPLRRFWLDEDNTSERLFKLDSARSVEITDVVDVVTVSIDMAGTGSYTALVLGTDYRLEPLNAPADFSPWERIVFLRRIGGICGWPVVRVTGQFGWPSVPSNVSYAVSLLAARYGLRIRQSPLGVVAPIMDEQHAFRVAFQDPDVAPIVKSYSRNRPFM